MSCKFRILCLTTWLLTIREFFVVSNGHEVSQESGTGVVVAGAGGVVVVAGCVGMMGISKII